MKYYVCITPFFPSEDSFVGPYVLDQVKAIARNSDYEVIVMKPTSFHHPEPDYEYDGIKVHRYKDYSLPSNIYPNRLSDRFSYKSFRQKLDRLGIKTSDISVCHAHVANTGSTALRLKRDYPMVRTVIQHHGFDVMSETNGRLAKSAWHKRLCRHYGASICNAADLNIGVSHRTLEYVKNVSGVNLKSEYVLYNGVDISKFHPSDTPRPNNTEFTIGCVANFWKLKDHITLIRAVEDIVSKGTRNIKVIFIGTGYTRSDCEQYVTKHALSPFFDFRDTMHHQFLPDFYRSLDLFVLPSYWEAFGCVYTEAYACGVPFIGVKDQGIAEIVDCKNAANWLIAKSDHKTLSYLIKQVMSNPNTHQILNTSIDIDCLIKQYLHYLDTYLG